MFIRYILEFSLFFTICAFLSYLYTHMMCSVHVQYELSWVGTSTWYSTPHIAISLQFCVLLTPFSTLFVYLFNLARAYRDKFKRLNCRKLLIFKNCLLKQTMYFFFLCLTIRKHSTTNLCHKFMRLQQPRSDYFHRIVAVI